VNELFAMALWTGPVTAYLAAQTSKLAPVMNTIRKGLLPIAMLVALLAVSFAPFTQAHSMPGHAVGGTGVQRAGMIAEQRDAISLDEAVRRAEAQYHAKVVRTDVQDEDGRKIYVLKLLSEDGRVVTVRVDAATGRTR
jgi:hypothetical protein